MKSKRAKVEGFPRSRCPIANTLDLVGDKWSLLVVRDMLHGKATYGELLASPEGIPTNILADRLRRLEAAGVIARSAYQEHPVRYAYQLTSKGTALGDVLLAVVRWGKAHIPGTQTLKEAASGEGEEGDGGEKERKREGKDERERGNGMSGSDRVCTRSWRHQAEGGVQGGQ
ncbi:MAG TPA: helix-turn-helix domain-containing protein [Rhodothermales bacterium]|nr:helix-turn-helix domain-containing protein [Rhodothermales bacterium]